jgi:poly(3-hydroxybutyrate) depolymerase
MSQEISFARSSICHGLLAFCFSLGLGCGSSGGTGTPSGPSVGGTSSGGSSTNGGTMGAGGSVGSGGASAAGGAKGSTGGSTITSDPTGGKSASGGTAAGGGGAGSTGNGGQMDGQTGGTSGGGGAAATGGSSTKAGGAGGGGSAGSSSAGGSGGSGTSGGANTSEGCGKTPSTLKSATPGQATPVNTISVGGTNRQFLVRWPSDYKNDTPYRLHMGLHGYGGNLEENGKDNFGLWSLSKNTTIFVTLAAVGGNWDATADLAYADAVLKQVESELCIDTSRVMAEGFSQGGAMAWVLTCSRPGAYRAVVGHSGGSPNFSIPSTCTPVAYLGSLGLSDVAGNSQATQTDRFAKANGCTIENLPTAPQGGHICTAYKGCPAAFPVTWCSYDGGHGFQPTDSGQSTTWMPAEAWSFLSPL